MMLHFKFQEIWLPLLTEALEGYYGSFCLVILLKTFFASTHIHDLLRVTGQIKDNLVLKVS